MRPALFAAYRVPVREKRDRFEAALEQMRAAWRGDPVAEEPAADGGAITLSPLPAQRPHPPIWAAAFGPKAIAQAGRLGLPYLASPMEGLPTLEANYARHREAHTGVPEPTVPVMRTVFVSRDQAVVERVRNGLGRQAAAMRRPADTPLEDWALVGNPDEVRAGIERYRERLGLTHLICRSLVPGADPQEIETSIREIAALRA
jgi:alkanesulfonate monooxygenase SsuD/methylene tetrahydromethanopterin reductase-like flavin-dependent oxidoreductase (luciferase family)